MSLFCQDSKHTTFSQSRGMEWWLGRGRVPSHREQRACGTAPQDAMLKMVESPAGGWARNRLSRDTGTSRAFGLALTPLYWCSGTGCYRGATSFSVRPACGSVLARVTNLHVQHKAKSSEQLYRGKLRWGGMLLPPAQQLSPGRRV